MTIRSPSMPAFCAASTSRGAVQGRGGNGLVNIESVSSGQTNSHLCVLIQLVYRDSVGAHVSGVGLCVAGYDEDDPIWRVPSKVTLRWDEVQNENEFMEIPVMKAVPEKDLHGFILHDACWRLLQQVPGAASLSLERLLSVCQSLPFLLWFNGVSWGHDFEGRMKLDTDRWYPWHEEFRGVSPKELVSILSKDQDRESRQ